MQRSDHRCFLISRPKAVITRPSTASHCCKVSHLEEVELLAGHVSGLLACPQPSSAQDEQALEQVLHSEPAKHQAWPEYAAIDSLANWIKTCRTSHEVLGCDQQIGAHHVP